MNYTNEANENQDGTAEAEPFVESLAGVLTSYHNSARVEAEFSDGACEVPEDLRARLADAALAAEYVLVMRELIPAEEPWISRKPFTQVIRTLAEEAKVPDLGPVWRWLGIEADVPLDVASAREFGKLAQSLRIPLETALASIQTELADRWNVLIHSPVEVSLAVSRGSVRTFDGCREATPISEPMAEDMFDLSRLKPFQLMDLRLILAEVRAAYGDLS
jgi:hypothetical protein